MENEEIEEIAVHMSLCAGILGVMIIFMWFGMGTLVLPVLLVMVVVLLLNLVLRGFGNLLSRKVKIKKWIARSLSICLVLINIFVSFCGLIYVIQDQLFFHNVKGLESRAFLQNKSGYDEISFVAPNGKTYHGMMHKVTDEKAPLVIYFGGNGECSYQRMQNLEVNNRWTYYGEYNFLCMDYEGYGLNDGSPNYPNMYEEALAVFDYAVSLPNVDPDHIVTMGNSMGTGVAVYLAANRPVVGLILSAPYANGYDVYNNVLPVFHGPMKWLVKQKLPSDKYAPRITCPTLMIASHADTMVPFSSSERLSELFTGKLDFIELEKEDHNNVFEGMGVYDRIQSFLERVASK